MKSKYTRKPRKEELYRLYVVEQMNLTAIGDIFGTSPVTARNWLKSAKVPLRSSSESHLNGVHRPPDYELKTMYIDENMTTVEIAKKVGVDACTIGRWIDRAKIERKTLTNAHLKNCVRLSDKELYTLYVLEERSAQYIATSIGVDDSAIRTWLVDMGIAPRSRSESHLIGKQKPSAEYLDRLYTHERLAAREIAKVVGVSDATILAWLKEFEIPIRTTGESLEGKYVGDKNPNWRGGTSFEPYCKKFNEAFKEKIRARYNRECFICGKSEYNNGKRLDVHHTNYKKRCMCEDVKCLFVPLCVKCHRKTGGNRWFWERVITYAHTHWDEYYTYESDIKQALACDCQEISISRSNICFNP